MGKRNMPYDLVVRQEVGRVLNLSHCNLFPSHLLPESGEWVAESVDLEGIITGGKHFFPKEVNETIKDALFTHFDIPPHLCNDSLLRSEGEPIVVEQKVYA